MSEMPKEIWAHTEDVSDIDPELKFWNHWQDHDTGETRYIRADISKEEARAALKYFKQMCEVMALEDVPYFPEIQIITKALELFAGGGE